MFGFGKKNKFHQEVINFIEDMAIKIIITPNNSNAFKETILELKSAGKSEDEIKVIWPLIVADSLCQPLEDKEHIDYAYNNFNIRQAAFFSISSYISNVAMTKKLDEIEKTSPEMYDALKIFWGICGETVYANEEEFAQCVITPPEGNPFKEE